MTTRTQEKPPRFSLVLETPAADPEDALRHFQARLSYETDPSDVWLDIQKGNQDIVVLDARSEKDYKENHIPGAVSMPHRTINESSAEQLSKDKVVIVYCWGPACNASTKAAVRLAQLGFRVKEMIGGLEYWRREGLPVEGENPSGPIRV